MAALNTTMEKHKAEREVSQRAERKKRQRLEILKGLEGEELLGRVKFFKRTATKDAESLA
jgi:hypothetical protein